MRYGLGMTESDPVLPVVYVTKFALTRGIIAYHNVRLARDTGGRMIVIDSKPCQTMYHKPFWYTDLAAARAHFETLRARKIASLEKQLKALRALEIGPTVHVP